MALSIQNKFIMTTLVSIAASLSFGIQAHAERANSRLHESIEQQISKFQEACNPSVTVRMLRAIQSEDSNNYDCSVNGLIQSMSNRIDSAYMASTVPDTTFRINQELVEEKTKELLFVDKANSGNTELEGANLSQSFGVVDGSNGDSTQPDIETLKGFISIKDKD
jgi:hypothetical protein